MLNQLLNNFNWKWRNFQFHFLLKFFLNKSSNVTCTVCKSQINNNLIINIRYDKNSLNVNSTNKIVLYSFEMWAYFKLLFNVNNNEEERDEFDNIHNNFTLIIFLGSCKTSVLYLHSKNNCFWCTHIILRYFIFSFFTLILYVTFRSIALDRFRTL